MVYILFRTDWKTVSQQYYRPVISNYKYARILYSNYENLSTLKNLKYFVILPLFVGNYNVENLFDFSHAMKHIQNISGKTVYFVTSIV